MQQREMSGFPVPRVAACFLAMSMLTFGGCQAWKATGAAGQKPITVKLVAFNDFHGYLDARAGTVTKVADPQAPGKTLDLPTGGVLYLSSLVAQLKAQNEFTTVVAAGDLIGGAPLKSSLFHHEPTIEALGQLGLEFSSVGNHEFDAGRAELLRMQNGGCFPGGANTCLNGTFAGAQFKYLAANVIDEQTGKPFLPGYAVKKFTLPDNRSFEMAFIGLVLKDANALVMPSGIRGLRFADEADTANALVPELRARGIESIVVLIHEGGYTAQTSFDDMNCPDFTGKILGIMDRLDPAIDVVVSGHTHRVYTCRHGGRLVTSASSEGRLVTDIDLTIDPVTKDVVDAKARQLAVVNDTAPNPLPRNYPALAKDSRLQPLMSRYESQTTPAAQRAIGKITQDLTRTVSPAGEAVLGDVVADAQLAATRAPEAGGAQIAFMNINGIRADLRKGNDGRVSFGDAFAIHPFGNGLITMSLTGEQIDALLEQQWTKAGNQLQVSSGFTYEWDAEAPLGERVRIGNIKLDGVAIDSARIYRVTVNEFLAQGGDGFPLLLDGKDWLRGVTDMQALEKYLADNSPLAPPSRDRIRRLNQRSN